MLIKYDLDYINLFQKLKLQTNFLKLMIYLVSFCMSGNPRMLIFQKILTSFYSKFSFGNFQKNCLEMLVKYDLSHLNLFPKN